MAADLPGHLAPAAHFSAAKEDVMLQDMGDAARSVRLVLAPGVDGGDHVDEGKVMALEKDDPEAVLQGQRFDHRVFGYRRCEGRRPVHSNQRRGRASGAEEKNL